MLFGLLARPGAFDIDILRVDALRSTVIRVEKVRELLVDGLKGDSDRLVLDWCWLTLFCGTDYTPRIAGFDYRKVYSLWRAFKSNESNMQSYLLSSTEDTIDTKLGLNRTTQYGLNTRIFESVLRASNCPAMQSHRLKIASGHKLRDIHISISDWKCNWNALKQAFCKGIQFEHTVTHSKDDANPTTSRIYWIDANTGEKRLAGEGQGINTRTAEYFSSLQACMPTSSIMDLHIRHTMSPIDFENLSSVISEVASHSMRLDAKLEFSEGLHSSALLSSDSGAKRYDSLTKESKAIERDPEACMELLKGTFWTLSMLKAEIPNATYYYPYTLAPSIGSMQSFFSELVKSESSLRCHIGTPDESKTEISSEKSFLSLLVPLSPYSSDSLPPLQFFIAVANDNTVSRQVLSPLANSVISHLKTAPVTKTAVRVLTPPGRTEQYQPIFKHTFTNNSSLFSQEVEENTRRIFEGSSSLQLPLKSEIGKYSAKMTGNFPAHGTEALAASSKVEELGIYNCSPALMFFNHRFPRTTTSEENTEQLRFLEQNKDKIHQWNEQEIDLTKLAEATHPLIRALTGVKHRRIACFEESLTIFSDKHPYRPFSAMRQQLNRISKRSFASSVRRPCLTSKISDYGAHYLKRSVFSFLKRSILK